MFYLEYKITYATVSLQSILSIEIKALQKQFSNFSQEKTAITEHYAQKPWDHVG